MRSIIVATGLGGIAAITAIAWAQANDRIASCTLVGMTDQACAARLTATRDYILTAGLSVGLAFIVVSLCVIAFIRARQPQENGRPSSRTANPARRPLLRP